MQSSLARSLARSLVRAAQHARVLATRAVGRSPRKHLPPCLALLGRLAHHERCDACPLVLAVLHDGGLEDLILGILPYAACKRAQRAGARGWVGQRRTLGAHALGARAGSAAPARTREDERALAARAHL